MILVKYDHQISAADTCPQTIRGESHADWDSIRR